MAKLKRLKKYVKRYGLFQGGMMLSAKIGYTLFCRPFYIVLSKAYKEANSKEILFESKPDFSDNARALFEYMLEEGLNENYKITWLVDCPKEYQAYAKKNVFFVKKNGRWSGCYTKKAHKATWQAGTIFFTHSMYQMFPKRKNQRLINLWHGCGYKAAKGDSQKIQFDALLVPSPLFVKTKTAFFQRDEKAFLPFGYPRYDQMLRENETAKKVVEQVKKRANANRVLLWLPTYRSSENERFSDDTIQSKYQLPLLYEEADFVALNEKLKQENLLLLLKYHGMQKLGEEPGTYSQILCISENWLKERDLTLSKLMGQVDGLITDYSSAAVDFVLMDRPMAFLLEDFQRYEESRGFVFEDPRQYMPGEQIYTRAEFFTFLEGFAKGEDPKGTMRRKLLPTLHNPCPCYSARLLEYLGFLEKKH